MRQRMALLIFALCSAVFVSAQESRKGVEMTGILCDQKCVKQEAAKASCDLSCTEKTGEVVFVSDEGNATKVANPEICKGKMGKKVKVRGEKLKDQQDTMQVWDVITGFGGS